MLFDKNSTRTRLSFEAGIAHLGGTPLVVDAAAASWGGASDHGHRPGDLSLRRGIVWRTGRSRASRRWRRPQRCPCERAHRLLPPLPVLADLQTVRERFGRLAGLTLATSATVRTTGAVAAVGGVTAGCTWGLRAGEFTPEAEVLRDAKARAEQTGGSAAVIADPRAAVDGAHVVVTDTWESMGQEADGLDRTALFRSLQVNDALLDRAAPDAIALHCLPAHRGHEITDAVLADHAARVGRGGEPAARAEGAADVAAGARSMTAGGTVTTALARQARIVELVSRGAGPQPERAASGCWRPRGSRPLRARSRGTSTSWVRSSCAARTAASRFCT